MLDGTISLVSIIIGFMGAIMPIILSMKNESKFVRYIFEKDTDELFKKYLKTTVKVGLLNAGFTLSMYLRDSILKLNIKNFIYYIWMFSIILFIFLTMRSMSYMITIFFAKDEMNGIKIEKTPNNIYTKEEISRVKEKHRK
ncbi:hypothetical protein [Tissierella creatinophila]|uniref:Uncharacterized protein n=1 Tax=Tissierella creatinophila DSM 6911 TaxID=1123403 RepID=A0A1U7M7L5_TISCR|nr:hypothetical protein [Tissierella creatinophila]OLS03302.1 hypothetical protein TICRE_06390 [Tissierella creatinophila DSM 6911]